MTLPEEFFSQFGQNSGLVSELYDLFELDPQLVSPNWREIFTASLANGHAPAGTSKAALNGHAHAHAAPAAANALALIEAYRRYAHFAAATNPLTRGVTPAPIPSELNPEYFGLNASDAVQTPEEFKSATNVTALLNSLKQIYCSSIGFEYMHIASSEEREFLRQRIETTNPQISDHVRKSRLVDILRAEVFESELHRTFVGQKRFSLEGGESLIAIFEELIARAPQAAIGDLIIGMAHRGRLSVMVNVAGKLLADVVNEFEDQALAAVLGAGDVKYHLGFDGKRSDANLRITVAPNPSHLEFVNCTVTGMARARQDGADSRRAVLPVLIHGDAAVIGQGVVFETINVANIAGYSVEGTLHIVVNNQIGFTATADESRSSAYCTDHFKVIGAPVFHVNAEDVDACLRVIELALEYRQRFGRDVVIDLICYRKYGHNEGDDPTYTQPQMYEEIKAKPPISKIYADRLISDGAITEQYYEENSIRLKQEFQSARAAAPQRKPGQACAVYGKLQAQDKVSSPDVSELNTIADSLIAYPSGFEPHPKLVKQLEKRVHSIHSGSGIEWGAAEALAFGTLVSQGVRVRLSGQDSRRGTFSHRHIILEDYNGGAAFNPLQSLVAANGGGFEAYNSALSENALMGFEFGYSAEAGKGLTLWEGQFGDFANGAQVIIDQFLAPSECKWGQRSGIVLLLPHGYEGQGPEHSSARLERYLQLCAEGNMSVCYPSTAANYFHLLRRQAHSLVQRPLVIMTPKSLLRNAAAAATIDELVNGVFQPVINHEFGVKAAAKETVLCCGKVYHDLAQHLEKEKVMGVRVLRVEELYPFPRAQIAAFLKQTTKVTWLQEEPRNMGAYRYVEALLREEFDVNVRYIGRPDSASTAAGSGKVHAREQAELLAQVR